MYSRKRSRTPVNTIVAGDEPAQVSADKIEYGDAVNTGIIRLLSIDGRASNKSMAKALGVSEPTIAARIRSMVADNVIQVVLQQGTHEGSPNSVAALIEFYIDQPNAIAEAQAVIAGFEEVFSAYETTRRPEIVANVRAESPRALNAAILKMAQRVPHLSQIHTLPILDLGRYSTTLGALKLRPKRRALPEDTGDALVALLQEDGRQSVSAIARRLGISNTAVRHRLTKLLNKPGVRIALVVDSKAMGYSTWVDLRATVAPLHIASAMDRFANHPSVRVIAHLSGASNLALFLVTRSTEEVDRFVREELRALPGLLDFTLMRVPRVFKYDYSYNL